MNFKMISEETRKKMSLAAMGNKAHLGKHHSEEAKRKISEGHRGLIFSEEHRKKLSEAQKGKKATKGTLGKKYSIESRKKMSAWQTGRKIPSIQGENNYRWIKDRSKLKKQDRRNDSAYKEWRMNVYRRDKFVCKINDDDCGGRIEAHHIVGWSKDILLRYEVSNGITVCRSHHPRTRDEEQRLIPYFKSLIEKK